MLCMLCVRMRIRRRTVRTRRPSVHPPPLPPSSCCIQFDHRHSSQPSRCCRPWLREHHEALQKFAGGCHQCRLVWVLFEHWFGPLKWQP